MPAIILALIAVLALTVLGMAGHVLFSPWLLMAVIAMPGSSCVCAASASCPVPLRAGRPLSTTGSALAGPGTSPDADTAGHDAANRARSRLYLQRRLPAARLFSYR